jgi:quinol monooxygenase YgiN
VVVRTWRTRIDTERLDEFDRFVRERSAPMFREQPGLLAVLYSRDGDQWLTLTLWRDAAAAERLGESASYLAAVEELLGSGMVLGEPVTEAFELEGAVVPDGDALLGSL